MERYLVNNRIPKDPEVHLRQTLQNIFKINGFRTQQKEIVLAAIQKKDVFVCMPTGGGKSLTFQLPAVTDPGTTIVIMPLLSLIRDQVNRLKELGINAVSLSGSLTSKFKIKKIFGMKETIRSFYLLYLTFKENIYTFFMVFFFLFCLLILFFPESSGP